jgi:phospholipid/cholesterol/gamma-HCH transport system substrate-binding protein
MEAEARYTYVGAAVVALVVLLVASVIWLKRTGAERDFARYTIYFEQQALDGLAVGADVNVRGISVGRVTDYTLSTDRLNRARVEVRIDRRTPVFENTGAVITRNFVTGIAQIRLVTSPPPGPPLERVPEGERFPVIAEGQSDTAEIAGRVTELGQVAGEAMERLSLLLSLENRLAVTGTLTNVREITESLKKQLPAVEKAIAEVGGAAADLRRTAAQIGLTTDSVGQSAAAALDDSRLLVADLRAVSTDAQRSIRQATTAIAALQGDINGAVRRLDSSATHLDEQLQVAIGDLRQSLDSMQRSLDRLSDPRTAVLGPERSRLGPGEKLP